MLKKTNMGSHERTGRLVVGAALVVAAFVPSLPVWAAAVVGLSGAGLLLTAAARFCVVKAMVGVESRDI
jgi:hypothetical protein